MPAIRFPSVCCAASPKITAVNAPPERQRARFDAGHAQRHEERHHDRRQTDQEPDRAGGGRIQPPEQRRPEAAADVARDRPAEDHQREHRHDPHGRFERFFERRRRVAVRAGGAEQAHAAVVQHHDPDEQRQQHKRLQSRPLDHARADLP